MVRSRSRFGEKLIVAGVALAGVGLLLVVVKIVVFLAWHSLWIVLAGAILVVIGMLLRGR